MSMSKSGSDSFPTRYYQPFLHHPPHPPHHPKCPPFDTPQSPSPSNGKTHSLFSVMDGKLTQWTYLFHSFPSPSSAIRFFKANNRGIDAPSHWMCQDDMRTYLSATRDLGPVDWRFLLWGVARTIKQMENLGKTEWGNSIIKAKNEGNGNEKKEMEKDDITNASFKHFHFYCIDDGPSMSNMVLTMSLFFLLCENVSITMLRDDILPILGEMMPFRNSSVSPLDDFPVTVQEILMSIEKAKSLDIWNIDSKRLTMRTANHTDALSPSPSSSSSPLSFPSATKDQNDHNISTVSHVLSYLHDIIDQYERVQNSIYASIIIQIQINPMVTSPSPHDECYVVASVDPLKFTMERAVEIWKEEKLNIKTVIKLNGERKISDKDIQVLQKNGIDLVELSFADGGVPTENIVRRCMTIMRDNKTKRQSTLVHCMGGIGRTGTIISCFLVYEYGFCPQEAIAWVRLQRCHSVTEEEQMFVMEFPKMVKKWEQEEEKGKGLKE